MQFSPSPVSSSQTGPILSTQLETTTISLSPHLHTGLPGPSSSQAVEPSSSTACFPWNGAAAGQPPAPAAPPYLAAPLPSVVGAAVAETSGPGGPKNAVAVSRQPPPRVVLRDVVSGVERSAEVFGGRLDWAAVERGFSAQMVEIVGSGPAAVFPPGHPNGDMIGLTRREFAAGEIICVRVHRLSGGS